MIILGLNSHEINSSCAIVKNNKLIYGSTEERFTRQKLTKSFPINSINYYLYKNNLKIEDINYVAQSWNPSAYFLKFNPIKSKNRISREDYFYTIPDNLLNVRGSHNRIIGNKVEMKFDIKNFPKILYIQHHDCHASNSFYLSEFDNAAILVCDFKGEFESTSFYYGSKNKINKIKSFNMPNSLGMFYATITQLLGYKPDQDEWKVMALSAMKKGEDKSIIKKFEKLFKLCPNGEVIFNQEYFRGNDLCLPNLYSDKLFNLLGGDKKLINKKYSDWHIAVATAMQITSEKICFHYLDELYRITKSKNLCLSGGFFMNSVINGKILENTNFQNIYIPFAPTDAGNSIGAALYVSNHLKKNKRVKKKYYSQIGPEFEKKYILKVLKTRKINYKTSENIAIDAAKLIYKYGFIGYCEGKSEFGDRALGNRSILGDPTKKNIKEKINSAIKFREMYRPFAPVAKKENLTKYFHVKKKFTNDYMEKVIKVKKKYINKIPSVIHFDQSARVQTVDKKTPNKLYSILTEFEKLSTYPILLNTSFNINGEPMVLKPEDAINTFYNSGLEVLILNDFIIFKN